MTKSAVRSTGRKKGLCALWWELFLSWQWDFNKRIEEMTANLVPPAVWDMEEEMLNAAHENIRRFSCEACNCWMPMGWGKVSNQNKASAKPAEDTKEKNSSESNEVRSIEKAI